MEWLAGLAAVAILWFGIRFIVARWTSDPDFSLPPVEYPDDDPPPPAPKPRKPSKPVDRL
jgi:hypothetical protein